MGAPRRTQCVRSPARASAFPSSPTATGGLPCGQGSSSQRETAELRVARRRPSARWRERVDTFVRSREAAPSWEMSMHRLAGVICAAAALVMTSSAHAANVTFQVYGEEPTDGYVDGTLFGLADSGLSTPTGVSFAAGSYFGDWPDVSGYIPLDAANAGSLSITSGQVDFNGFGFKDPNSHNMLAVADGLNFTANFGDHDFFKQAGDGAGQGGFVAFQVSPAPEPSSWSLAMMAVGLVGVALRRRVRPELTQFFSSTRAAS